MWSFFSKGGSVLLMFMAVTLFLSSIEKGNLRVGPIVDDFFVMSARIYRSVTEPLPTDP